MTREGVHFRVKLVADILISCFLVYFKLMTVKGWY